MKYLIQCEFGPDAEHQQYIGTREELIANIRATWSKVPHAVEFDATIIRVVGDEPHVLLATFTLINFDAVPLPGHF